MLAAVIYPTDILEVIYSYNLSTKSGTFGFFTPIFNNGIITLNGASGSVVLPVTTNNLATFADVEGAIKDSGISGSGGNLNASGTIVGGSTITAGSSGHAGSFISYPSAAGQGTLAFQATANGGVNNFTNVLTNKATTQSTTWSLADPGAATGIIPASPAGSKLLNGLTANPTYSVVVVNAIVTAAALSSGHVTLLSIVDVNTSYQILDMKLWGGTNFATPTGSPTVTITDGTTNYSVIPEATLEALTFNYWGSTDLPFSSGAGRTPTAAGQVLYATYPGGSSFATGLFNLTITAVQLA